MKLLRGRLRPAFMAHLRVRHPAGGFAVQNGCPAVLSQTHLHVRHPAGGFAVQSGCPAVLSQTHLHVRRPGGDCAVRNGCSADRSWAHHHDVVGLRELHPDARTRDLIDPVAFRPRGLLQLQPAEFDIQFVARVFELGQLHEQLAMHVAHVHHPDRRGDAAGKQHDEQQAAHAASP
ncbi:hypothetical protein XAP6164_1820008 [Xanthomonas phaseoli pv. phaseoli]|nr:hypothetical protein XAP6164_1820008 [Xanthomonas phaseoli pv. phaseoli]